MRGFKTPAFEPACDYQWELSEDERSDAYEAGFPAYVLEGIEHTCCLDPMHDGPHTCDCGATS